MLCRFSFLINCVLHTNLDYKFCFGIIMSCMALLAHQLLGYHFCCTGLTFGMGVAYYPQGPIHIFLSCCSLLFFLYFVFSTHFGLMIISYSLKHEVSQPWYEKLQFCVTLIPCRKNLITNRLSSDQNRMSRTIHKSLNISLK